MIFDYVKEHSDMVLCGLYEDNGYSGTSFDRPELKRMIRDIARGIINVVIVKDLSRLGRNYIRVGELLDSIFPLYNVKLISLADNIDGVNSDDDYFYTAVLNILNHSYPQDISSKVKSTFRIKKINGNFIGVSAPYGYLNDFSNVHKFIIDKETSKIVRKIFNMLLSGKSCMQIANQLNKEGILPPRLYKIEKGIANYNINKTSNCWNSKTVKYILRNKTYIGYLEQYKQTRINYKIYNVPKENWIIVPNHHKAIIKEEIFNIVQEILDNTSNRINKNNEYDVLSGYVRCVDCNEIMITKKGKNKKYYYCSTYIKHKRCSKHYIPKQLLEELVLEKLKEDKDIDELNRKIVYGYISCVYVMENNKIKIEYKR